jgi:hypothetical protein
MVFTHGFFFDPTQYYFRLTGIFSKHPVKTYPQLKIKKGGTSFEQLDSYLFLPLNNPVEDFCAGRLQAAVMKTKIPDEKHYSPHLSFFRKQLAGF